jgi:hypothetical protein
MASMTFGLPRRFIVGLLLVAISATAVYSVGKKEAKDKMAFTLAGAALVRKALVNGAAVNQIVPDSQAPYPVLTFDQVVHDNLGTFDPSDSSFVIPEGITFAEFRAQVVWATNSTGLRQLVILRKSPLNADPTKFEFFTADPVSTQQANTNTTTDMDTGTVGLIPVVAGERYAAFPLQTSGGDLAISGGTGTVFGAKFYSFN